MKCFFHSEDLDGHCSGAIIKQMFPECEMIGVDYNNSLLAMVDSDEIDLINDEVFFVVDFCFKRDDMQWLSDVGELIWIDHHQSSIEKMDGFKCDGLRKIGKAGCELTWEYSHPNEKMPKAVELLGIYDTWRFKEGDETLPFQYGMRTIKNTLPDSPIWNDYLVGDSPLINEVIKTGQIILDYERKQNEIYAKGMYFETKIEGYRAIVINKAYQNSKIFDSVYDPGKHDIMVLFGVKPGEVKYSFYTSKDGIDVSTIAKRYGGGGHMRAAGAYTKDLIF